MRNVVDDYDPVGKHRMIADAVDKIAGKHRERIERAQGQQRLFLALALLTQVVFQWAWGVVLFVSPAYSQTNCSGATELIFFLAPFTAREINDHLMTVWVLWLLFSLGITLVMTIVLTLTSPTQARAASSMASNVSTTPGTTNRTTPNTADHSDEPITTAPVAPVPTYRRLWASVRAIFPSHSERYSRTIFWYNVLCVVLWMAYIIGKSLP